MHKVELGVWRETLKNMENARWTPQELEYGYQNENHGKWEAHTVARVIWLETLKNVKKKIHKHFLICNIARNNKNVENEKGTLSDLEYG